MAFSEDRRTIAIAVAVSVLGLLPMLAFDLSAYPPGESLVGLWTVAPVLSAAVFVVGGSWRTERRMALSPPER